MTPHTSVLTRPAAAFTPLVLVGIAIAALSGCAQLFDREGGDDDLWDRASGGGGDITLSIRNDNYYDARVYARWNGERDRLGLVTGLTSEVFTMSGRSGSLRLEVDFVATRNFVSRPVQVGPGDHLTFRIPSRVP